MAWRTTNGLIVKTILDVVHTSPSKWNEDMKILSSEYTFVLGLVQSFDRQLQDAHRKIDKLEAENAFMLRLINERINERIKD